MRLLIILAIFLSIFETKAQEDKIPIAIYSLSGPSNFSSYTQQLSDIVKQAFATKSRFDVVATGTDAQSAKHALEEGKGEGINWELLPKTDAGIPPHYVLTGRLIGISAEKGTFEKTNSKGKKYLVTKYKGTMKFALSITNVETKTVFAAKDFDLKTSNGSTYYAYSYSTPEAAVSGIISASGPYLTRYFINEHFPVLMKIIQVEKYDKKGFPSEVLVKGGEDMDFDDKAGMLDWSKTVLSAYVKNTIEVDGEIIERPIEIGKLKLIRNEGKLSVCGVKDGKEAIQAKLNEKVEIFLKVTKY